MTPSLKKKVVKKKAPRHETRYITEAESNEMFHYYCETKESGGVIGVARKFGRARSSVIRASKQFNWAERYEKIRADVRAEVDVKITRKEITNLDLVRSIKNTAVKRYLEQMKAGKIEVNTRDTLAAITTEEELLEKLPEGVKPVEQNPEEVRAATEFLNTLDGEFIKKLGDAIGSGQISLEEIAE